MTAPGAGSAWKDGIVLVKLGGSLITDKRRERAPRDEVIRRLASEIGQLAEEGVTLIVGHGSGSFGHVEAERHEVHLGFRSAEQLPGIAATQRRAAELHRRVVAALHEAGAAPFSFAPSSVLVSDGGRPAALHLEPLLRALDLGLLPVLYGDVVMDRSQGCAICSTERLFVAVVEALLAEERPIAGAAWLGETDGVLDPEGRPIPEIRPEEADDLLATLTGAAGTDVTGGIRHRLEAALELAALGVPSRILDGREPLALRNAVVGTVASGTRVGA